MINLGPRLCAPTGGEDGLTGTRLHQAALADAHLLSIGCWSIAKQIGGGGGGGRWRRRWWTGRRRRRGYEKRCYQPSIFSRRRAAAPSSRDYFLLKSVNMMNRAERTPNHPSPPSPLSPPLLSLEGQLTAEGARRLQVSLQQIHRRYFLILYSRMKFHTVAAASIFSTPCNCSPPHSSEGTSSFGLLLWLFLVSVTRKATGESSQSGSCH